MAVLNETERAALHAEYMRECSATRTPIPVLKADLRAAVDAIDVWVNANVVQFNAAIPQPARNALTAKEKARLLAFVVRRRFEIA